MANTQAIQEALLQAVDAVVTQRTNELKLDKTIIGIVKRNIGLRNNKPVYRVQYSGGVFEAICQNKEDMYSPNTGVYVLIPQGDFSNEKIIIGQAYTDVIESTFTSTDIPYIKLCNNLLSKTDEVYGLHSWHEDNNAYDLDTTHRYQYIYDRSWENNKINFDQNFLNIIKDKTVALMVKADFQTILDAEQRTQSKARYGIIFNFAFSVNDTDYKYEQFVLDSRTMRGNSFAFSKWSTQYKIFDIDKDTLSHLDSIIFFQENFKQDHINEMNLPLSNPGFPDILTKNLEISLLKPINEQDDYSLKVEPYNDSDFVIIKNSSQFKATFLKKLYEDLTFSNDTQIYWFKESAEVTNENHELYNPIGGLGWAEIINAAGSRIFTTTATENRAFKNNYKCVVKYNDITLTDTFSIYSIENETEIKLESNLGTEFAFDAGTPIISVKIKDNDNVDFIEKGYDINTIYPKYKYQWCLIDNSETKTFLELDQTSNANDAIAQETVWDSIEMKTLLPNGEIIDPPRVNYATRLYCPINKINNQCTIVCYVQRKDVSTNQYYGVGSAEITLTNTKNEDISAADYRIQILNSDQVFKYDVYGKAPTDLSNKNPVTIYPLWVKLMTLADVEVEPSNYQVEWIFPDKDTLLIAPNSDNIVYGGECTFDIEKNYNPDYCDNQIVCHIIFNDKHLYKNTRFYFGKEGDNSVNGTDIIAKIECVKGNLDILSEQPVTLYTYNNESFVNTDSSRNLQPTQIIFTDKNNIEYNNISPLFDTFLYQRAEKLEYTESAKYILAGNHAGRYFDTGLNVIWRGSNPADNSLPLIQNIRAEVRLNSKETYYAFVSLPIIEYYIDPIGQENLISIDRSTYLNEIVYNSDGRNPTYNQNQGLKLNLPDDIIKVVYTAKGGFNKDGNEGNLLYLESSPCFSLLETKDSKERKYIIEKVGYDKNTIYVLPNDSYSGSITNNYIEAKCYAADSEDPVAIVCAPINMTLDIFGLASLNAWDGNSVTIDNDGGYVMAPQIGAGEKDKNNRFTGILMGKTETYTGRAEAEKQTGLFGYACGLQSMFLDAETGNATFGLPDGYTIEKHDGAFIPVQKEDEYGEGRIELRPGGESKIGGWKIGRRSLYYTMKPIPTLGVKNKQVTDYEFADQDETSYKYVYSGEIGPRYNLDKETPRGRDYAKHHRKDIGVHDSGILLSSDPPYLSIVGTMLTQNEIDQSMRGGYLEKGDSIEIQLDPQTPTVFTIFRHNSEFRKQQNNSLGDRTFLAGINARGQLQANVIGSSMNGSNQSSMYFELAKRFAKPYKDYYTYNQANEVYEKVVNLSSNTNPSTQGYYEYDENTQNYILTTDTYLVEDKNYIGAIFEAENDWTEQPFLKLLVNKNNLEGDNPRITDTYISVPSNLFLDFDTTNKDILFNQINFTGISTQPQSQEDTNTSILHWVEDQQTEEGHFEIQSAASFKQIINACLEAASMGGGGGTQAYWEDWTPPASNNGS